MLYYRDVLLQFSQFFSLPCYWLSSTMCWKIKEHHHRIEVLWLPTYVPLTFVFTNETMMFQIKDNHLKLEVSCSNTWSVTCLLWFDKWYMYFRSKITTLITYENLKRVHSLAYGCACLLWETFASPNPWHSNSGRNRSNYTIIVIRHSY